MHATNKSLKNQQKRVTNHVRTTDCYGFFNLLTGPELLDAVEAQLPEHRERFYPPTVTLSLFMTQVLSSDGSCQNAVNGYVVGRVFNGLEPCSTGTGAYCKARQNLPVEMVSNVARQTGRVIVEHTPDACHWRGRRVKLVDGTTVTMPDTPENQAVYPQQKGQNRGWAFQLLEWLGSFAWGVALCWMRPWGRSKVRGPENTRCFASCSIAWSRATWCWLIATTVVIG